MTKQQTAYATAGAVTLAALLLWAMGGKKKQLVPAFFLPGQTVNVIQGALYTMRLPRGQYTALGDEIIIAEQRDLGVNTDVIFTVISAANDYTARIVFVDDDDPGKQFNLTLIAKRTV